MTLKHIAIIPDGNRRWAKKKGLLAWKGHEAGVSRAEEIMRSAFDAGVEYFTFWAASISNLEKRPAEEVEVLVRVLKQYIQNFLKSQELTKREVRFQLIGKGVAMVADKELSEAVAELEQQTRPFSKHFVTVLFGYDGQMEMLEAIGAMRSEKNITEKEVRKHLSTGFLPDVDLVIRTGGEPHWSAGFLMWQTANSQFYFTETFWPDFDQEELQKAFADYKMRERRLGK